MKHNELHDNARGAILAGNRAPKSAKMSSHCGNGAGPAQKNVII